MDAKQVMALESYSRQLVKTAENKGQLDAFLEEVKDLVTLFDQDSLDQFLSQNLVPDEEKKGVLLLIESNCSLILADFLREIMAKKQYNLIYAVLQDVLYRTQYTTGQFDMVVKSVVPVTPGQLEAMKRLVRKKMHVDIREVIEILDDSLLGGFVIEINHKVIDASIRHQLQDLKQKIT